MANQPTPKEIVEAAEIVASRPAPIAPYWDGQNFEQCFDIPLGRRHHYSLQEWDEIFARFTTLLTHEDWRVQERAIERLKTAIESEQRQKLRYKDDDFIPRSIADRLLLILNAIAEQELATPGIFENFCKKFMSYTEDKLYCSLILQWLDELAGDRKRHSPSPDAILAARILFGGCGSTWEAAGENLISTLDCSDLTIRACAAYQIGQFYSKAAIEQRLPDSESENPEVFEQLGIHKPEPSAITAMPPIEETIRLIRDKEIQRPGIAGAFLWAAPKSSFKPEVEEWILDILEQSPSPEPYIQYFPCNLAFDASERFCGNSAGVRRLMKMGRRDIAILAATEENELLELGYDDDSEIVRLASWGLAYDLHILHPKGAELGFVELIADLPEVDIFLLFSSYPSPYAAVIYAKGKEQKLPYTLARAWSDRIFPESVRGNPKPELPEGWYQRGYIKYCGLDEERQLCDRVIIGYRSDTPWNPKDWLENSER